MELTPSNGCCAIYELHGFDDALRSGSKLDEFLDIYNGSYAGRGELCFVLFTDNLVNTSGKRLAQYIQRNKLGTITATAPKKNAKSGKLVQCWIWDIDWKALRKWEAGR